ncbi:MAG: nucleotidyltransferase family protein [Actinomycetota bacterium]|nr:nucleotidyltransferase family protein [Actinomycetota bacterium]
MARRQCPENSYPQPLLAVAGYKLPGATRAFPDAPLSDQSWSEILRLALAHRMTGLLCAAIDAGAFPATEVQMHQIRTAHTSAMVWVLLLERKLFPVIDLLTEANIETRVLKGAAVAHLDYSAPELRSFIDLDLLIRAEDFDHAVRVLAAAGFVRRLPEPRPGFDRRFDKGTTFEGPGGYELDLHRTFVLGPWGLLVDLEGLWGDGQEVMIAGRTLCALSRGHRFLHACYHAALGDWPLRLGSLRDVAEMLRGAEGFATELRELASCWRVEAVVAAAVADTWRLLGLATTTELSSWAQRYVPSRQDEARLALHTQADKTFTAQALATLHAMPRVRDKVAYARALILPDARYVAGRHPSALARFRYGLREARRGRGNSQ